jgi:hypothetical protein
VTRDFSTRPQEKQRSPVDAVLVALGLLALALSAAAAHGAWRDAREKRVRVDDARRELAESRVPSPGAAVRSADASLARQALFSLEAAPPLVLAALGNLMPPDVRLDGLVLEYGDALHLQLSVVARDAAAYDQFLARLESSPDFSAVSPGEENRDGEVRAQVSASYGRASR